MGMWKEGDYIAGLMPNPSPTPTQCPTCGAATAGNFCNSCGAPLGPRTCGSCRSQLSPGARFCHRCGIRVASGGSSAPSERTAWIVAGTTIVLLVGTILYQVVAKRPHPVVPDMASDGAAPFAGGQPGQAPDISQMSPQERFNRLYDRVLGAAERGDSVTVIRFSPMALGAYQQLDTIDADARYHAAMIHLALGQFPEATALADTMLREVPGHLFGYVIRGEAAGRQGRTGDLKRSYADFLSHYDAEMKANRPEYRDHQPVVEAFSRKARPAS